MGDWARRQRRQLVRTGLVALVAFAAAYFTSVDRPGAVSPDGYFGWADQHNYRLEAEMLRAGALPGAGESDYAYGLGYPMLAVPSLWIGIDRDPFVLPNALLFAADTMMVVVLGTRLRSQRFGLLTAGALVLATPLLDFTVQPWNTSVTVFAVLVALVVATDPRDRTRAHALALGAAIGMCFAARYVDAVFPAVIGGVGLLLHRPRRVRAVVGAVALAGALAVPVLWSHDIAFGDPLKTPYAHHTRNGSVDQSLDAFNPVRAPLSFVEVFVSGTHNGTRTVGSPMLAEFPWLVLAPFGLVLLVRARGPGWRVYAVAAAASVVGATFYLSFWAGTGNDLQYGGLRYYMAWVPLWALLAAYGVATIGDRAVRVHRPQRVCATCTRPRETLPW